MKLFNRFAQDNETTFSRFENSLTTEQMLCVRGGGDDDDNKGVDPDYQADDQQDTWNT